MGQVTNPIVKGISVLPIDRESGPGAGAGAQGNNSLFLGNDAGLNSNTAQLIVIGSESGKGGIADPNLVGSTIVGAASAQALQTAFAIAGPVTIVGAGNLNAAVHSDTSVIVGANNAATTGGVTASVLMGDSIVPGGGTLTSMVIIGHKALGNTGAAMNGGVVIGEEACSLSAVAAATGSVVIGHLAGNSLSNAQSQSVVIGQSSDASLQGGGNVVIGASATAIFTINDKNNVVIGLQCLGQGSSNVVIGHAAQTPSNGAGQLSVIIGDGAGRTLSAALSNVFLIETNDSNDIQRGMLFGDFLKGNLVIGNSSDGVNRDVGGVLAVNVTKLLNGTKGGINPVGGGYFYVTGGFLHWVDPNGTDSQLSETVAGQLASSALTAFTNNAAAQVATLTNGPTVGNPTKWIPINDNGTIRNIPAW